MLKGQKTVVRGVGRVELRNEETRYRNEGFKSFKKLNQKKNFLITVIWLSQASFELRVDSLFHPLLITVFISFCQM